jgi:hypothetical protein
MRARDRIDATERIPEFPPHEIGTLPWVDWHGRAQTYTGPLRELGRGIPRPRSRRPMIYRMQRAAWHLALGYASGFPVRDVLAFTLRGFWAIPVPTDDVADAIVEELTDEEVEALERFVAGDVLPDDVRMHTLDLLRRRHAQGARLEWQSPDGVWHPLADAVTHGIPVPVERDGRNR